MAKRFDNYKKMTWVSCMICWCIEATGQDYHAIQGSSLAGSLGIANNPASIVNNPYRWDIDIFSVQLSTASNLYTIDDYSLLSSPNQSKYYFNPGQYSGFSDYDVNLHLLNVRVALDLLQAIAFGLNSQGYGNLRSGPYNYTRIVRNAHDFFSINDPSATYQASFTGNSWLEFFATYSRTLYDDGQHRLNGGLTLRATRGLAGGFAAVQNAQYTQNTTGFPIVYNVIAAQGSYGYSNNFDSWQNKTSAAANLGNLLHQTSGAFSGDLGFEYLVATESRADYYDLDENFHSYDWKFGVSLLDVGQNQYKLGAQSIAFDNPRSPSDGTLDQKFTGSGSLRAIKDSLETIATVSSLANRKISIVNPTRMVINIDRPLGGNFAVNGDLSINLTGTAGGTTHYYTQSLTFITVTPRWETSTWGVYLPIQYNDEHQIWVGGAFKAGPLLVGVHNWANILTKSSVQNGGGYIALIIHDREMTQHKTDKRLDCPPNR